VVDVVDVGATEELAIDDCAAFVESNISQMKPKFPASVQMKPSGQQAEDPHCGRDSLGLLMWIEEFGNFVAS
jgi:hypothetical protein